MGIIKALNNGLFTRGSLRNIESNNDGRWIVGRSTSLGESTEFTSRARVISGSTKKKGIFGAAFRREEMREGEDCAYEGGGTSNGAVDSPRSKVEQVRT